MPELPEVEAVVRKLRADCRGQRIVAAEVFRCATPEVAESAPGRRVVAVERRAKHILVRLSGGLTLHTHLRMSGNLRVIADHRLHGAYARVVLSLSGGGAIVLEDPRALARMRLASSAEVDAAMAALGPEPLSPEFTAMRFVAAAKASRLPAKLYLMDQSRVAGLGNIYAAEALHRARVHPERPMNALRAPKLQALHAAIVQVLEIAVQSAIEAYSGPGLITEAEVFPVAVYGREGESCFTCRRKIRRIPQGGRSTYFCPGCQR
jgi:formamidopyrimidine-DNA glycosylase